MSEWREVRLGDLCYRVCSGGTPKSTCTAYYDGGTIPWLNTKEINYNRIYQTESHITEEGLNNSSAKWIDANSVIVAMYGATAGRVAVAKVPMTTNQACCNLMIDKSKADYNFIYYYLSNNYKHLLSMANGAAQQNLNAQVIKDFIISLPEIDEQYRIASFLSAFDDKIAINRRICENLEAQAQALFKHWFIDFAPFKNGKFVESELGMIPLSEISEQITDGVHNSVKDEPNSNYMLLSCKNIVGGVLSKKNYRSISKSTFESLRLRTKLAKGDVLLSSVGTIGEIAIVEEEPLTFEFQRSVAIVKPKKKIGTYFLYNALLASKARLQHAAHGAVQQCLFIGDLKKFEIVCCNTEKAFLYNETVKPLFEEIAKLHQESARLATLRDTLLPKLMSGQIKV